MDAFKIYDFLKQAFSEDGYKTPYATLKCKNNTQISIEHLNDKIKISFIENKPIATVKKLVTISVVVSGVFLNEDGGVFVLDRFPDIPFKYNKEE